MGGGGGRKAALAKKSDNLKTRRNPKSSSDKPAHERPSYRSTSESSATSCRRSARLSSASDRSDDSEASHRSESVASSSHISESDVSMRSDTPVTSTRGPGRPRKDSVPSAPASDSDVSMRSTASSTIKRGPGRPKKLSTSLAPASPVPASEPVETINESAAPSTTKRGRGRPKNKAPASEHTSESEESLNDSTTSSISKRGRLRPSKKVCSTPSDNALDEHDAHSPQQEDDDMDSDADYSDTAKKAKKADKMTYDRNLRQQQQAQQTAAEKELARIQVQQRLNQHRDARAPEKADEDRYLHSQRVALTRTSRTPAEAEAARAANAQHQRNHRFKQPQEDIAKDREKDRLYRADRRARMSAAQADAAEAAERQELLRQQAEKDAKRERKNELQRIRRANKKVEEIEATRNDMLLFNRNGLAQQPAEDEWVWFNEEYFKKTNLGAMDVICPHCTAKHWLRERPDDLQFNVCCRKGHLKLETPSTFPTHQKDILLNDTNLLHDHFMKNIRQYNACCSFVSVGMKCTIPQGHGDTVLLVNGHPTHILPTLIPAEDATAKYAQLYVLDSNEERQKARMAHRANQDLNPNLIQSIIDGMKASNNQFIAAFQRIGDKLRQQRADNIDISKVFVEFNDEYDKSKNPDVHPGRQNAPTDDEGLAYAFKDDNHGEGPSPYRSFKVYALPDAERRHQDTFLNLRNSKLQPMCYPLLYPDGQLQWQPYYYTGSYVGITAERRQKGFTHLQWAAAMMQRRDHPFRPHTHCGKLFQQWLIDTYLASESMNLQWMNFNQDKLQVKSYNSLHAFLEKKKVKLGATSIDVKIINSGFTGGPRDMRQSYLDALAIVRDIGGPDVFITFTANPDWDEVKAELKPGQNVNDNPDLLNRVFHQKFEEMMEYLTKKDLIGKVVGYIYVVEFQKRGKPHVHLLLSMAPEDKFRTKEQVDKYFCAEFPDKKNSPELFKHVTQKLVHGPCNANLCMQEGSCSKHYPMAFKQETEFDANRNCKYRRRNIGRVQGKNGRWVSNAWVVPYIPALITLFDAHINAEVVADSQRAIKYLFKYIFKGFDVANLIVVENGTLKYDEIKDYIAARFVTAFEAHWRLMEYVLQGRSHTVIRLPLHLEETELDDIGFEDGYEVIPEREDEYLVTMLTAFFKLCAGPDNINDMTDQSPEMQEIRRITLIARNCRYVDVVKHFIYEPQQRRWRLRLRNHDFVCCRMRDVTPYKFELFALRMLLLHVKGPTCFADLRTWANVPYRTFVECAQARNLVADDNCYYRAFDDYCALKTAYKLRELFAGMLLTSTILNGAAWWEKYRDELAADFKRRDSNATNDQLYELVLQGIERVLIEKGKHCAFYGLPQPKEKVTSFQINRDGIVRPAATTTDFHLNAEQEIFASKFTAALEGGEHKLIHLNGPGGSGKTTCYRWAMAECKSRNLKAKVYATTGIAATLLEGGVTVHHGFGVPAGLTSKGSSYLTRDSAQGWELHEASVLMIDEVSMMNTHVLTLIDELLRGIMGKPDELFGGKIIVVGGDFRQLLPVVQRGTRVEIFTSCVVTNWLWDQFDTVLLTKNMRADGDHAFCEWLLQVGTGKVPLADNNTNVNLIEIPKDMLLTIPDKVTPTDAMVEAIFGNDIASMTPEELGKRAIVATTNVDVLAINNAIIDKMPTNEYIFLSRDTVISDDPQDAMNYDAAILNKITPSGLPPHEIKLKVGTVIILMRNIRPAQGLCNGTRMQVTALGNDRIEAKIISESNFGASFWLWRMTLISDHHSLPCKISRNQFPIIPAFAMTINKSQGQTFDHVGIHLNSAVFSHGQLYVALSRSRTQKNVKVYIRHNKGQQGEMFNDGKIYTENIVYREVFVNDELHPEEKQKAQAEAERRRKATAPEKPEPPAPASKFPDLETMDPQLAADLRAMFAEEAMVVDDDEDIHEEQDEPMEEEEPERMEDEPDFQIFRPMGEIEGDPDEGEIEVMESQEAEHPRFILLQNSIKIREDGGYWLRLYNMCPINSVANGLLYLLQHDIKAGDTIRSMATFFPYFARLIHVLNEPAPGDRDSVWGGYIRDSIESVRQESPHDPLQHTLDMTGDPCEIFGHLCQGFPSVMQRHVGDPHGQVVQTMATVVIGVTNPDPEEHTISPFNFPDRIVDRVHALNDHGTPDFGPLLFVSPCENMSAVLTRFKLIPKKFVYRCEYGTKKYGLKYFVEYVPKKTAEGVAHFRSYVPKRGANWVLLDDQYRLEQDVKRSDEKVRVFMLVYGLETFLAPAPQQADGPSTSR